MTLVLPGAPFPITYRDLWLPPGVKGLTGPLPTSVEGRANVTLSGARRGTTTDGVHFTGVATSNLNIGALYDNQATVWVSHWFRFDQAFSSASATDQYLWGKYVDATHFVWLVFKAADGKLYFEGQDGGANDFSIAVQFGGVDVASWNAGQWYQILHSISAANRVRLRLNDNTVVTDVSAIAYPAGGDIIFGDFDDPGAGTGFEGTIADINIAITDISDNGEQYLSVNVLDAGTPLSPVNSYPLDEGRGVTAYDRGSGGNDGTLDTAATWKYGQVEQPLLSLDGINDVLSTTTNTYGDISIVLVMKIKQPLTMISGSGTQTLFEARLIGPVGGSNDITLSWLDASGRPLQININGSGVGAFNVDYFPTGEFNPGSAAIGFAFNSYSILIVTVKTGTPMTASLFRDGLVVVSGSGAGPIKRNSANIGFGARIAVGQNYAPNKFLMMAIVETAFTPRQGLTYSRYLKNVFNLPIAI